MSAEQINLSFATDCKRKLDTERQTYYVRANVEGYMASQNHILVTGAPRTGTTFVGHVLAMARGVGYVREPFNSDFGLRNLPHQFLYLYEGMDNEAQYRRMAGALMDGKARFLRLPVKGARNRKQALGRALFGGGSNYSYLKAKYNPLVSRYLIKDPMACLASQYLHEQFGAPVVVMVRHPLPTIASMRRVNLDHKLDELVNQKYLYETYLKDILGSVRLDRLSSLERRALLWASLHYMLHEFRRRDDSYIVVEHTQMSANPVPVMRDIYDKLDLAFTPYIEGQIRKLTEGDNPGRISSSKMHVLARNSRKLIARDYCKFDAGEERIVHAITDDVAKLFYASTAWPQPVLEPTKMSSAAAISAPSTAAASL